MFAQCDFQVLRSSDYGNSWTSLNTPIDIFESISIDRDGRLLVGSSLGIITSTDEGDHWSYASIGAQDILTTYQDTSGRFFAGTLESGVYGSADGLLWNRRNTGVRSTYVRDIGITPNGDVFVVAARSVHKSTDHGETWVIVDSTKGANGTMAVDSKGHIFISRCYVDSIMKSTDNGASWSFLPFSVYPYYIYCMTVGPGDRIYAGSTNCETYTSADGGKTWKKIRTGPFHTFVYAMAADGAGSLYIAEDFSIMKTTDLGNSWEATGGSSFRFIISGLLVTNEGSILASFLGGGISRSTDGGSTWETCDVPVAYQWVESLAKDGGTLLYAAAEDGVLESRDDGRTWHAITSNLLADFVLRVKIDLAGYVFAGTAQYGLYRSESPMTGFQSPRPFVLQQNFPNPFNSTTRIGFELPAAMSVRLTIYNILGQRVQELMSGYLQPGHHDIVWNAAQCSSGVYLCHLDSPSYSATLKLVLLR